MNLEQQVVSLELAKKLKELGVKQESIFVWMWSAKDGYAVFNNPSAKSRDLYSSIRDTYSAFTVADLGEMLPNGFQSGKRPYNDVSSKANPYEAYPHHTIGGKHVPTRTAKTEADARAKMLIYLIENDLISPKDGAKPRKVL